MCFAYINPEGSTYSANFKNKGKFIMMGDLNGHSNTGDDFIRFDSDIDHISLPTNYSGDIDLLRRNHDTRPIDNRGKEILDLCKV